MVKVEDEDGNVKTVPDKPLKMGAQLWSGLKQHKNKRHSKYIDSEKHFIFVHTRSPLE